MRDAITLISIHVLTAAPSPPVPPLAGFRHVSRSFAIMRVNIAFLAVDDCQHRVVVDESQI